MNRQMLVLSFIIVGLLQGCAGQPIEVEPVSHLHQFKYADPKNFYRSGSLEKQSQPKGFFLNLRTKT